MRYSPRGKNWLGWGLMVVVSLSACAPSKVSQCNSLIEIANGAALEANELTDDGQTDDQQAMLQAADAIEQAAQEMEAVELSDSQLQDYQTGFIEMYRATAGATRDYIEATGNQDRSAADVAVAHLQQATQPEEELVQGINTYCTGNAAPPASPAQ
ncbi:MAG: hypothetical protein HC838_00430 [Spirulinaceae cyanobacterium RM2_2_10]|nr:hypothetical protein [Spirulinaceae cyanobacterium SM2_1_0]NJO18828.1 hypothetical protein [Spirulinaceae cyanobacterium RM2_2_10]